jgi:hypothetical protein
MASNYINDEKPNLRPTKRIAASGKSLYLHHNPNQLSNKSYIHATWNDTNEEKSEFPSDKKDPFGIQQPNVAYSLNKQQRWEILNDFRQHIANESSLSSDNDRHTQSDSEQPRKKQKFHGKNFNKHQTKYRLYEHHNTEQKVSCVRITSNSGEQRIQTPRKTYMQGLRTTRKKSEPNHEGNDADIEDDDEKGRGVTADVTYVTVVPPPTEKHLANIRKHHGIKNNYIDRFYQEISVCFIYHR